MVYLVRSEDRKPSRRVFPLLQNLDLDTVTFAQVQSTGEPISIEDMNEQEMLDLIIVNLARLAVAGEWTGLLDAGGATGAWGKQSGGVGGYVRFPTSDAAPFGQGPNTSSSGSAAASDFCYGTPIVPQVSGTLAELGLYFAADASYVVGFYESDDDGLPTTLVGKGTLTNATGGATSIFQTSITGSGGGSAGSLTAGELYWMMTIRGSASSGGNVTRVTGANRAHVFPSDSVSLTTGCNIVTEDYTNADSGTGLPDTFSTTNMEPGNNPQPKVFFKVS